MKAHSAPLMMVQTCFLWSTWSVVNTHDCEEMGLGSDGSQIKDVFDANGILLVTQCSSAETFSSGCQSAAERSNRLIQDAAGT